MCTPTASLSFGWALFYFSFEMNLLLKFKSVPKWNILGWILQYLRLKALILYFFQYCTNIYIEVNILTISNCYVKLDNRSLLVQCQNNRNSLLEVIKTLLNFMISQFFLWTFMQNQYKYRHLFFVTEGYDFD